MREEKDREKHRGVRVRRDVLQFVSSCVTKVDKQEVVLPWKVGSEGLPVAVGGVGTTEKSAVTLDVKLVLTGSLA